MTPEPALPPRLLALSPGNLEPAALERFVAAAKRAREAGLDGLVLRESSLDERVYFDLARRMRELFAGARPGWFAVHDRAHLAAPLRADAVHVGFRSLPPRELRAWLEPRLALGLSTHADDDARPWGDADYLFHGPVFDTESKRGVRDSIGLAGLVAARGRTTRPIWALGGIVAERVRDVLATGVRGVAVRGALFDAADPGRACERLLVELSD
ncbi:MAG: thiamine phosphate synthase [Planctomycetes bacterium]|nr:thiamine phosphate synthase [Planctomycetota bacterium]